MSDRTLLWPGGAEGVLRDLGGNTLAVLVTGIGGPSDTRCTLNWREVR